LFAEIGFVGTVYLGGNLEGDAQSLCDPDGAIGPFFGRDAPQEGHVATARGESWRVKFEGNSMVDGCHKVGIRDRLALRIRDRD